MRQFGKTLATSFKTVLLASAFAVPVISSAQAVTLQEAITQALATNPDIGVVAHNREAVDEELRQARGLYLPQIDLSAGAGIESNDDSTSRAGGGTGKHDVINPTDVSLTLQQRVFDGFEAGSTVDREKARVESAANRVQENAEFLTLDTIGAYLEVVRQRELLDLSKNNLQIHIDIVANLQERLAGGGGSRADVSQAEARSARARNTLTTTYNDLRDAEANYTRIVGHFPEELDTPEAFSTELPGGLDDAVDLAVNSNPTIRIFEADVRTAEAEVDLSEVPFYPSVNLEASSEHRDEFDATPGSYEQNNSVMLRLRWNLFRGGIDRAARQEALSRLSESKNQRYSSVVDAQREMRQSWFALESNRQSVTDLASAVQYNTETRDAYRDQFEVAQRTLLDVLDAENELFTSRGQLVSAMTNEQLASYRILALSGQLMTSVGVEAPEQAVVNHQSWADGLIN
ncbi:TolC family outer membrane protein [Kiloniella antarctica]|uniref:TolC family outer membrane protein n=1 Tax=Kiloniella antarctica TaxID=1550907 RepID=A0ABW5BSG9_9PROT